MGSRPILFISHDATRTGAPIIFLNFLRWVRDRTSLQFEILLVNGGELEREFGEVAPVHVLNEEGRQDGIWSRYTGGGGWRRRRRVLARIGEKDVGLVYANTAANGAIVEQLSNLSCPVVTHVHELAHWMQYCVNPKSLEKVFNYTTRYIAVSQAVKNSLVQNFAVGGDKVEVIYGFVPVDEFVPQRAPEKVRRELGIDAGAFVVGGAGTTDWRKGPDLFIQLARAVHSRVPEAPVHFVWVGGAKEGPRFGELRHDVVKCGLQNKVHFLGSTKTPAEFFNIFDVFALVSREDPFPLVALESAALGKPILAFDGAGGMNEFIEQDCGVVVPYLDVASMADHVVRLMEAPELRLELGQRAARKVRERHNIDVVVPKIVDLLEAMMGGRA